MKRYLFAKRFGALLLVSFLFLTGCSLFDSLQPDEELSTPVSPPNELTPPPPQIEGGEIQPPVENTATPDFNRGLTVWLVTDISGGSLLQEQIVRYAATQTSVDLNIEQKIAVGPGGITSYLQAAQPVAASILPDLALVPTTLLPELIKTGQIFPLDGLISEEEVADLYPVATSLARVDGGLYGFPQAVAGLTHLAYNPGAITTTVPSQWSGFVDTPLFFAFPAGSSEGTQLLLQFYLAEGGTLTDEDGNVNLDRTPLENALTKLQAGLNDGTITPTSGSLVTQGDTWALLQNGGASAILTSSQMFRQNTSDGQAIGFAQLPGPSGPLTPQLVGWVWVITTPDINQQRVAADLISWITNSNNMGTYSWRSTVLPSKRTAFEEWPADSYTAFLNQELERATIIPPAASGPINDALNAALRTLLTSPGTSITIPTIVETAISTIP